MIEFFLLLLNLSRCANAVHFMVLYFYGFIFFWIYLYILGGKCELCCPTSLEISFFANAFFHFLIFLSFPFSLSLHRLGTINQIQSLCVLESDFGFAINCKFKNAGMFRIRNLGGVKAHFGLGKESQK